MLQAGMLETDRPLRHFRITLPHCSRLLQSSQVAGACQLFPQLIRLRNTTSRDLLLAIKMCHSCPGGPQQMLSERLAHCSQGLGKDGTPSGMTGSCRQQARIPEFRQTGTDLARCPISHQKWTSPDVVWKEKMMQTSSQAGWLAEQHLSYSQCYG